MSFQEIKRQFDSIIKIPDEQWDYFQKLLRPKTLKKDEYFVQAGESSSDFAFITKGLVRFFLTTYEGHEFNQSFKSENEFIMNFYPIMAGVPSPFSVQCLEDTELLVADYNVLAELFEQHMHWNTLARKLLEKNYLNKSWREIQLLMFEAKDRYLNFAKSRPDLLKRIPQFHIAQYLGINPATLNRLIKKMQTDGEL